mmetsp:Transcript_133881/g.232325  ORF Transcript_133881/g.232325 Transcript_133881/m.232325 type:complete len:477 (-) Transcript_133881:414-1844(-)
MGRSGKHPNSSILQTAQDLPASRIVRGRNGIENDGVDGGDVLQGHADGSLATHLRVEGGLLGQGLQRDGVQHRAVAVQQGPVVQVVTFALLRQVGLTPTERLPCALLSKFRETLLVVHLAGSNGCQRLAGGGLVLRVLSQRDTDGVPKTIKKQRPDTNGRLHAPIFALTSFGHPQMDGVIPPNLVHLRRKQTVGLHHDQWVAGLHGEHKVVEVVLAADPSELKGRLHHPLGRVPVPAQGACRQAPVVGSDPDGAIQLFALEDQRSEELLNLNQLLIILFVRIHLVLELLCTVHEIARVHANLVDSFSHFHSHLGGEMDVSHQRGIIALLDEALLDGHAGIGFLHSLHCEPDNIAAGVGTLDDLVHCGLNVPCVSGSHSLESQGVLTTHWYLANPNCAGGAPLAPVDILAILHALTSPSCDNRNSLAPGQVLTAGNRIDPCALHVRRAESTSLDLGAGDRGHGYLLGRTHGHADTND